MFLNDPCLVFVTAKEQLKQAASCVSAGCQLCEVLPQVFPHKHSSGAAGVCGVCILLSMTGMKLAVCLSAGAVQAPVCPSSTGMVCFWL